MYPLWFSCILIAGIQMVSVGGRRSLVNCGKRCVYVQVIIFSAVDFFIGFLWSET